MSKQEFIDKWGRVYELVDGDFLRFDYRKELEEDLEEIIKAEKRIINYISSDDNFKYPNLGIFY